MGKRGPAPKPTELKKLAANPGCRPLNESEPTYPSGEVPAPDILDEIAAVEWERLCVQLRANGLLTVVDRAALAAYCIAWSRWVQAEEELKALREKKASFRGYVIKGAQGGLVVNPLIRVADAAMANMLRAAQQFGMTPSSRTGLKVGEKVDDNPFTGLTKH